MEGDMQEIQVFLANMTSAPVSYADIGPCVFWFVVIALGIGLIGTLGTIAISDDALAKRTIYIRQLSVCASLSGTVMIVVTYFDFLCLVIPFSVVTLLLIAGLLWYLAWVED